MGSREYTENVPGFGDGLEMSFQKAGTQLSGTESLGMKAVRVELWGDELFEVLNKLEIRKHTHPHLEADRW